MKTVYIFSILILIGLLSSLPKKTTPTPKGMVSIPAGEFLMGIDDSSVLFAIMSDKLEGKDAMPQHVVYLDNYFIDRYEVTYKMYATVKKKLVPYIAGREYYPVSGVSWVEAVNFCRALGKRLPTESEWEKAARGTDERLYSWGNTFDPEMANLGKDLMYVGSIITDKSIYGAYDMVGNVSEWTSSWYLPYPESEYKNDSFGKKYKVARGGSYNKDQKHNYRQIFSQVIFRHSNPPNTGAYDTGFRCAWNEK